MRNLTKLLSLRSDAAISLLKKASVCWCLFGLHELICLAGFLFALWTIAGVLAHRI